MHRGWGPGGIFGELCHLCSLPVPVYHPGHRLLQGISLQGANLQESATACELNMAQPSQSDTYHAVAGGHGHPWCILPLLDLETWGLAGAPLISLYGMSAVDNLLKPSGLQQLLHAVPPSWRFWLSDLPSWGSRFQPPSFPLLRDGAVRHPGQEGRQPQGQGVWARQQGAQTAT